MLIIPAIDLMGGAAVRLKKGRREEATVYRDRPWELVAEFATAGAKRVHVVDLDGAFAGERHHSDVVARMCADNPGVELELGGGIRDQSSLAAVFAAGVRYAVLGTAAIKSPELVEAACRTHPGRVIVAVDARDGRVAVEGWVEATEVEAAELAGRAAAWGAAAILYTDIDRDGVQTGPNVDATAALAAAAAIPVIASGGISSLEDLRRLTAAGIPMAVVGRALYEGNFTVAEAIAAAR